VILHFQQKRLGIGLIIPRIYIRNKQANSKIAKLIQINEESVAVEYRKKSIDFTIERVTRNTIT